MRSIGPIFLFISILATILPAKALPPAMPLFDPTVWLQSEAATKTPEVVALRDWIAIHYDYIIERPWEPSEREAEYGRRLQAFQKQFCPQATALCELKEPTEEKTAAILLLPETIKSINAKLAALNSPVRISDPVRVPSIDTGAFNFIIGIFKTDSDGEVIHVSHEALVDIGSYLRFFRQMEAPRYFALGSGGQVYVLEDTLIGKSMDLAETWSKNKTPQPRTSVSDTPSQMLDLALKDFASELESYQKSLSLIESLNWVVYNHLSQLTASIGKMASDSQDARLILLKSEKLGPSHFLHYLLFNQSFYGGSSLIDQLGGKVLIDSVFREYVSVFLGLPPYGANKDQVSMPTLYGLIATMMSEPELFEKLTKAIIQTRFSNKMVHPNSRLSNRDPRDVCLNSI